jgi:TatD DNase family protein
VHSVQSATPVLDLIEAYLPPERGRVVLHWFTGSLTETRRAVELGCYFSINAKMADTKNGKDIIVVLPLDRILTETDGPFAKNSDGKPSTPADVIMTVSAIASIRSIDTKKIKVSIQKNLQTIAG